MKSIYGIIAKWEDNYVGYTPMRNGIEQRIFRFDNNFGASIVRGPFTYGGNEGLYELACIKFGHKDSDEYDLYYDDDQWSDVHGYLTLEDIDKLLSIIKNM